MSDATTRGRSWVVTLPFLAWTKCELCSARVPHEGSLAFEPNRRVRCATHALSEDETAAADPFDCCGGNDDASHHTSDCSRHPWSETPDPRCMTEPWQCPHKERS